jgi:DNA adenine methylase
MRAKILEIINTIPRKLYVEPFGGSGAMFFGKEPEQSIYNDRERLLVNFFRELRKESSRRAIQTLADVTPGCKLFFRELRELCLRFANGEDCSELVRELKLDDYPVEVAVAFAFFYVQNFVFGGKPLDSFGRQRNGAPPFLPNVYRSNVTRLVDFAEKLRLTQVDNSDFREVLGYYDDATTLFYCDPPYECETSKRYTQQWTSDDTKDLVNILLSLKGSFVLSCYDGELYKPLEAICEKRVYHAVTTCSRNKDARKEREECVYIKNNGAAFLFKK